MEIQQASVTGLFKTALIIIGAFVALRFIGRLMIAKRNMEEERQMLERERKYQQERNNKLKNFGKINISGKKSTAKSSDAEDVDFEEVK